ncbi:aminopeptidase N-like [Saccoglossus kowalevskii]|uniref:Aminopeptidase n=1 Tax=Saccoglossus kowalevskii TaxID=10224 RepID=A0ABM0MR52_SACKO|nr:PREDICTED: aminopeptidase N-like [Saccoglossus kowalevskii]
MGGSERMYLEDGELKKKKNTITITKTAAIFICVVIILLLVGVAVLFYFVPNSSEECEPVSEECSEPLFRLPEEPEEPTPTRREPFEERLPNSLYPLHYDLTVKMFLYEYETSEMERFTFEGHETIYLRCDESTNTVKMNSRFLNVNFEPGMIKITESDTGKEIGIKSGELDEIHELFVVETVETMEAGNNYTLEILDFGALMGNADDDQYGMYFQSYEIYGETRWICNTKFTPNYAREVFPCFDEPHFRATFNLSLIHHNKRWAKSNMPIYESVDLGNDWNETRFETTPNMVTYLLVMVVADFDYIETTTTNGYPLRVWAREDRMELGQFALEAGSEILTAFETLIGVPYGLPKLDMIAIPDYAAGATEFWGCVLYRENRLLYNATAQDAYDQQSVAAIVAHELAHMWYGNYLTCDWWSHIWLNEGFASFHEYVIMQDLYPELKMDHQFLNLDLESAFRVDARSSSAVPQIRPISGWRDEITGVFDTTTYSRGASMLRHLASFLDIDVIRRGLNSYVTNHLYESVVSDQLWQELTQADRGHRNTNVKMVMDTWTLQHGHPVVTVTRTSEAKASVVQDHFLSDPNDEPTDQYANLGYLWYVPLTYTHASEADFTNPNFEWLQNTDEPGEIDLRDAGSLDWVVVNINQVGFYRVNYDDENWERLAVALKEDVDFQVFPAPTRTALLDDCFKISQAFYTDNVNCHRLSEYMYRETEYPTWELMIDNLPFTYDTFMRTAEFGQLELYWRHQITPIYEALGWDFGAGNSLNVRLRTDAINTACKYGNEECVGNATDLYAEWMADPDNNPIDTSVRSTIYCTAIKFGSLKEWMFAHEQSMTNPVERTRLRSAMGCSKDAWLLERYIEEYFTDPALTSNIIEYVRSKSATGFSVAWHYVMDNFEVLNSTLGESAFDVVWDFYPWMNTDYDLKQLLGFAAQFPDMSTDAAAGFYDAKLNVETNIAWMQKNRQGLKDWLNDVVTKDNIVDLTRTEL